MGSTAMDGVQTVALAGLGGYGHIYVNALLDENVSSRARLVAGIDPVPDGCPRLREIRGKGIPIFHALDEFFASQRASSTRADLVILSTPLQLHCEQAVSALGAGYNVLCEKPLGAHPQQVRNMIDARDRAGLQLAIGYQWSFSEPIQNLKRDILAGNFGAPKRLRTRVYWPRDEKYYSRSLWAGKKSDRDGRPVFDSPANNACAHHLHNMFYCLGDAPNRSDWPAIVEAELYRAHKIENYDTIALRCITQHGVEVLFYASHSTRHSCDPVFAYEFEHAVVYHGGATGDRIVAEKSDGSRIDYGQPARADSAEKLFNVLDSIRFNRPVLCGPEAAGAQTACIFAAQQSMPSIVDFPKQLIVVHGKTPRRQTYAKDLDHVLNRCFDECKLPSELPRELGVSWAVPGAKIPVADLDKLAPMGTDAILQPVNGEVLKSQEIKPEVTVAPAATRQVAVK